MNEESGTTGGTDMDEAPVLDPQGAAAVLQQARDRARRELAVRRPVLFLIWAVVVFVGYGAMWLSVRGQHPYRGPAWEALLLAFLLFVAAAGASANVVDRAASGVGGRSELQRGIFALALLAGFAALEIEKQALATAGASRPRHRPVRPGHPAAGGRPGAAGQLRHCQPAGLAPAGHRRLAAGRGGRRRVGRRGGQPGRLRTGRRRGYRADGGHRAPAAPVMTNEELDPVIHVPARLRIVVTLAALPPGDDLSFTRLQDVIGLTPGNLITHLRKLDDAGYVTTREERQRRLRAHRGRADQHRPGRAGPLHHRAPATARLRYPRLSPGSLGCGLSGVISSFIHG